MPDNDSYDSGPTSPTSRLEDTVPTDDDDGGVYASEETVVVPTEHAGRTAAGPACLVAVQGSQLCRRYSLAEERTVIGRSADCDICTDVPGVSRTHAAINRRPFYVEIEDLGSTNGTIVNGRKVHTKPLKDGDTVRIGKAVFKFLEGDNIEGAYFDEIYRLTTTDELTRTHNRRFFFESFERELTRARRHNRPLSLIIFDIDHFKKLNDTFGHTSGDAVLRQVSNRVKSVCRQDDVFARYGGEEFAVLVPEIGVADAAIFAERIRNVIDEQPFGLDSGTDAAVTDVSVSICVAEWQETEDGDPESSIPISDRVTALIQLADARLYEAKDTGRNRVVSVGDGLDH